MNNKDLVALALSTLMVATPLVNPKQRVEAIFPEKPAIVRSVRIFEYGKSKKLKLRKRY